MSSELRESDENPWISIGLPVYNGEKFLRQSIESLLAQTFRNFELIISDNASTDTTPQICKEYAEKDKRIRYLRQSNNIDLWPNFLFLLREAKFEYFMWASSDDYWEPTFIEKNIQALQFNPNLVGSISKVNFYGNPKIYDENLDSNSMKYMYVHPISGTWNEKVAFYLKFGQATIVYGIYRTDKLRLGFPFYNVHPKDMYRSPFYVHPEDMFLILNVLKYGDLNVVDELLMHRYARGVSTRSLVHDLRQRHKMNWGQIIFLLVPLISWCIKNFGLYFVIKNLPSFIRLHYIKYGRLFLDMIHFLR